MNKDESCKVTNCECDKDSYELCQACVEKLTPVLITTTEHSVYFGRIDWSRRKDAVLDVEGKRNAWEYRVRQTDGHKGVYALALSGPQTGSRVGPPVTGTVRNLHCVDKCTAEAVEAWDKATW